MPRVAFELISALDRKISQMGGACPLGDVILLGRQKASPLPALQSIRYEYLSAPNLYIWENISLARRTGRDPILGLQNRNPVLKENCATMIHGLQVLTQPGSYSTRAKIEARTLLPLIGMRHRTIMTVSNFSAKEIAENKIARMSKIRVVYNGIDHREVNNKATHRDTLVKPKSPYVVAQASTRSHKNIKVLLSAFAHSALSNYSLVLFGSEGRADFERAGIPVPSNVQFAGTVDDEALMELLRGALCLAFPSLTEGFGLPPLEAMSLGTPALVSNGGAIPEVCGDAAIVLDPYRPDDWREAIVKVYSDAAFRERYREAGRIQAGLFTWDAAAETMYQALLERHY